MKKELELKSPSLNIMAFYIHKRAVEKGFYEQPINVPEQLMLIVSEASEAMEAHRTNKIAELSTNDKERIETQLLSGNVEGFLADVKDTFQDELADTIIRLLDLADAMGVDINWHVATKHEYNLTRPYKHNKAY